MTYQITFETADGTVENFRIETTKRAAERTLRFCAKGSPLNEAFGVTRWFIERDGQTIAQREAGA